MLVWQRQQAQPRTFESPPAGHQRQLVPVAWRHEHRLQLCSSSLKSNGFVRSRPTSPAATKRVLLLFRQALSSLLRLLLASSSWLSRRLQAELGWEGLTKSRWGESSPMSSDFEQLASRLAHYPTPVVQRLEAFHHFEQLQELSLVLVSASVSVLIPLGSCLAMLPRRVPLGWVPS